MKELFAPILITLLIVAMVVQGIFFEKAQHMTGEALEIAGKWQEAYTELQQDYSLAAEKIEQLEYELRSEE
ncbi:hypothetical protein SAMN05216187_108108 [Jeotgalicoccus aerolatus]|uniref:Uncharacterized protein n=1 Tax=Jeotgalicoccus aerolatus TaxID=709510 RepID=A0A1G9BTL6_9STAP|nr:hypothetical protein [Jeotgalicoccus aerolatus]SDK42809.1 hypothetical protein SAMN05216187_108108 [Jeotgalicoccus aerolatus]